MEGPIFRSARLGRSEDRPLRRPSNADPRERWDSPGNSQRPLQLAQCLSDRQAGGANGRKKTANQTHRE